jgi:hypothetical protein
MSQNAHAFHIAKTLCISVAAAAANDALIKERHLNFATREGYFYRAQLSPAAASAKNIPWVGAGII